MWLEEAGQYMLALRVHDAYKLMSKCLRNKKVFMALLVQMMFSAKAIGPMRRGVRPTIDLRVGSQGFVCSLD